jgi:hypothetical protein
MTLSPDLLARARAITGKWMTVDSSSNADFLTDRDLDLLDHAIATALQEQREQDCKAVCPYCRKGVDHADVAYAACRKIRTGARG